MTVTRFQQKRGTSAQWAASVVPLRDGEFGIDKDTGVIKMGDGFTMWADLDPIMDSQYLPLLGKAKDSYRLDGLASTDFLRADGKAVDSELLDGHDSSYFLPATGKAVDSDLLDGFDSTYFLPATGKAADADKLDGVDSTAFALAADLTALTSQTSGTRKLATNWGAMTSFPSGALPGDICLRTDVGTGGSLWTYVAVGRGVAGWVHKGPITCTSTTRPATAMCYVGLEIFETDTSKMWFYTGLTAPWSLLQAVSDTGWVDMSVSAGYTLGVGTDGGAKYRVLNGICYFTIVVSSSTAAANATFATLPATARPTWNHYYAVNYANAFRGELKVATTGVISFGVASTPFVVSGSFPVG